MNIRQFVVVTLTGGALTIAAVSYAAPPTPRTVTIPRDTSWMPASSSSAVRTSAASDVDAVIAAKFHFSSDRPHVLKRPPPVDPVTVGRMPEVSDHDVLVPQGCISNPHQQKCH